MDGYSRYLGEKEGVKARLTFQTGQILYEIRDRRRVSVKFIATRGPSQLF